MRLTDPFGINITYYTEEKDISNYFSDLPDELKKKGFDDFDPYGITSFFSFRYPVGNHTMFKDFKRVPFGHKIQDNKIKTYWHPQFNEQDIKFEDAIHSIEKLLYQSIKSLTDGKKLAIPLSGGVDSSLVVALCRHIYPDDEIHTYSAGFYGDDEFSYARVVAEKFNTIHKEIILKPEDYIGEDSLLAPLIQHKGEPLHPNEIALATVEQLAKEDGCDIAVCGEGADDIFGGYGQNLRMYMNYRKNIPFFKFFLSNYRYFSNEDRKKLLREKYNVDDYQILMSILKKEEIPDDLRNKTFYFIQKIHTTGLIIRGANAMRFNNLKPGFPFINQQLVDYVNTLPFDYKVHWKSENHQKKANSIYFREISETYDVPKYILKKIAEKYLPEKIIYRPKYGFPVPFEKWFKDLKTWELNQEIFKTEDISSFSGWKKFMLINLNTFFEIFQKYKK